MDLIYACFVREENFAAIASENPNFDREALVEWLEDHPQSLFIRDETNKAFDCQYMDDVVFSEIYEFDKFQKDELFHKVIRRSV